MHVYGRKPEYTRLATCKLHTEWQGRTCDLAGDRGNRCSTEPSLTPIISKNKKVTPNPSVSLDEIQSLNPYMKNFKRNKSTAFFKE